MFAQDFVSYIDGWSIAQYSGLDDLADRANFQANVIALLLCTVLVSVRQYFMEPMICYVSTLPGGKNADGYITDMCWVEGTVPLNFSLKVSHKTEDWDELLKDRMTYYQWIPFVLGLQAILYYFPRLLWQIITYNRMGMDLEQLARDACDADCSDEDTRDKITEHVARNIELMLYGHRKLDKQNNTISNNDSGNNRFIRHVPNKRHGNLLVSWYLMIKLLYCGIGLFQLWLMYNFLRLDRKEGYKVFGHRILWDILSGKDWTETQVFPRVGMCRHSLEQLGNINQVVAQCLLPINMLNEKIYIFLFFFLTSVLIVTIISIPLWLYRIIVRKSQRQLVGHCLRVAQVVQQSKTDSADKSIHKDILLKWQKDRFVVEFLRQDGNFILRMLSMNVGDLTASRIVKRLFEIYRSDGYMGKDLRNIKQRNCGNMWSKGDMMLDGDDCTNNGFKQILLEKVGNARVDNTNNVISNKPMKPLINLESGSSFSSDSKIIKGPTAPTGDDYKQSINFI